MELTEQTCKQIERALVKAAAKFPPETEPLPLTDIYIQVKQDGGELLIFDDEDRELTRCVIEEWIGNTSETFYNEVQELLHQVLARCKVVTEHFNIIRPYSFVLENEEREALAELYVADDDTIVIGGDLLAGLDADLNSFWEDLQKR